MGIPQAEKMLHNTRWFRPLVALSVFFTVAIFIRVALYDLSGYTNSVKEYAKTHAIGKRDFDIEIKNSSLGFEKVFVLNLPERVDKLDAFTLASEVTGFNYEVIEGVKGADVSVKSLPPTWPLSMSLSVLGCYRAHMNFVRRIIKDRLSTALIFEDDADWDIDLKAQLTRFAIGSRLLINTKKKPVDPSPTVVPQVEEAPHSPYGDGWDMLWIGHCASEIVEGDTRRLVIENDPAVTPPKHRTSWGAAPNMTELGYDNHTRIVYESQAGVCMYAYALSLEGAKKALYYMSLSPFRMAVDMGFHDLCKLPHLNFTCISIYPTLVDSHKAAGNRTKDSDIGVIDEKEAVREKGFTWNIVRSVRINMESLLGMKKEPITIVGQWDDDKDVVPPSAVTGQMKLIWEQ